MKKTYNVCSKSPALKFLSVMFFFTLFFLGMSSSVSAQAVATSRASAGSSVDADYSISQKAQIGVTDEVALEILESELKDVREESIKDLSPADEAENSARMTFLVEAVKSLTVRNTSVNAALQAGHSALALQVANYQPQIRTLVDGDGIVREYVQRLK